jgi:hypothetical protein
MEDRSMLGLNQRARQRVLAATLLLLTAGCTTVQVTPQALQAPTQTYRTVVLARVDAKDPAFAYVEPFFRDGFVKRLNELKAFDSVSDASANQAAAGSPSPDAILVTATLTDVNKGDLALRIIIGMGAGRERVAAQLDIQGPDGKPLGRFEAAKAYAGGAGIGGGTFIDIEDLTKQVGEQAAQSLVDWSRGKLASPAS